VRRISIPILAFIAGTAVMSAFYLGFLTWLEGWDYAAFQFNRDRQYVLPIMLAFGAQSALYSVLRFRLYLPVQATGAGAAVMGANGGTSAAAMVACCLHHVTNVAPLLGLSAATAFLARNQQPLLQLSFVMNAFGILIMLSVLQDARKRFSLALEPR